MESLKEKIGDITNKESSFQVSSIFKVDLGKNYAYERKEIYFFNKYIYFMDDQTMKIYDNNTFKEISTINLPFIPNYSEIIEKNIFLMYKNEKLYIYKYNLKQNQLYFMFCVRNVLKYKYLSKRKEILVRLSQNEKYAKLNLEGKVTFHQGEEPIISFKYEKCKNKRRKKNEFYSNIDYSFLTSFDQDKYIITINGYSMSSDDPYDEDEYEYHDYYVNIFNSDNMKALYSTNYDFCFESSKINDKLFSLFSGGIYYYDEIKNKIIFISENISDKLFYINNSIFGAFVQPDILYLIDLSNKNNNRKIKLNEKYNAFYINKFVYMKINGVEHLYILMHQYKKIKETRDNKRNIIKGIIN